MSGIPAPIGSAFTRATAAADQLRQRLPDSLKTPLVAVVCGSGLGTLQQAIAEQTKVVIPYEEVEGMPKLSVDGHEGKMVFGFLRTGDVEQSDVPVLLLVGRAHYYEGHSMGVVSFATRVCRCLDVKVLIVTNAAGGLNPEYNVGDLVLLSDHLNLAGFAGINPLLGPNETEFGVRFQPLSDAYDLDLRRRVHRAWKTMTWAGSEDASKKKLHEGVYAFLTGPNYETRAECRLLRLMGADVVGMSTVPEVITARHSGMRVVALSLVTNNAVLQAGPAGDDDLVQRLSTEGLQEYLARGKADHAEVIEAGLEGAKYIERLVTKVVCDLDKPWQP